MLTEVMKTPCSFPTPSKTSGFSLAEVTIAIGIISFGLTAILGILPVGMSTFRTAVDTSVSSQIVQRVSSEASQAEFSNLVGNGVVEYAVEYFDEQGNKLPTADGAIYHSKLVATTPAPIPGGTLPDLARLTIDIVHNPGNQPLARDAATGGFVSDSSKGLVVSRHSVLISRHQ